jgi:hypothetical protein
MLHLAQHRIEIEEDLLGMQLFPELAPLAKQSVNLIKDPEVLQNLGFKMFSVHTSEEAKQFLLTMGDSSEEI